jgi:hypothetical protein
MNSMAAAVARNFWREDKDVIYRDKHGIVVTWRASERHLFHATRDGVRALCNRKLKLPMTVEESCPSTFDPSNDLMTCERCAERVYRVRATMPAKEISP